MELTKVSPVSPVLVHRRRQKTLLEALGWYIVLCLIAAVTVVPFIWVLSTSLKGPNDPIVSVPPRSSPTISPWPTTSACGASCR